ncbi:MAG: autotransporter outer membrane beta-barrel domain-containing protein [Fusobacteriaceae bacterium]|jgi:hypothetical protein|nr:autotransporter outer membrane beta-barrel domain-containing protein [Fusobacteriaceae bacterium]
MIGMKKINYLFILFFLLSLTILANEEELQNNLSEIHQSIITNRGLQQIREQYMFNRTGIAGKSNSNQYFDGLFKLKSGYDNDNKDLNYDYKSKTKGFLMGTTSNYVKYPNLRLGVDYGYIKSYSKFQDDGGSHTKTRSYGLNMFASYNLDKWNFIGKIGYIKSKNILHVANKNDHLTYKNKNFLVGSEFGRYIDIGDNFMTIYPYVGLNYNQYRTKDYGNMKNNLDGIVDNEIGISLYKLFWNNKLFFAGNVYLKHEISERKHIGFANSKIDKVEVGKNTGNFNISLSYFTSPDFSINVRYEGFLNKNYYYDLIGIGISHNF